ncbi:hypothetical protein AC1031_020629 [Aphanomyces cochlioides]|nr:hypothetical protein AC1031_020629 [Aphanomyces cochlioides]
MLRHDIERIRHLLLRWIHCSRQFSSQQVGFAGTWNLSLLASRSDKVDASSRRSRATKAATLTLPSRTGTQSRPGVYGGRCSSQLLVLTVLPKLVPFCWTVHSATTQVLI